MGEGCEGCRVLYRGRQCAPQRNSTKTERLLAKGAFHWGQVRNIAEASRVGVGWSLEERAEIGRSKRVEASVHHLSLVEFPTSI